MITAVDSSVLLDVLVDDPVHALKSKSALRRAVAEGSLIICECVLAEVAPALESAEVEEFLSDWNIAFVSSTQQSSLLAGEMFRRYLERGGRRGRVVADFLVAAHAQTEAQRLLARDRGFYRDYFKRLKLWDPSNNH